MAYFFDQVEIKISGMALMARSASLSSSLESQALRPLGQTINIPHLYNGSVTNKLTLEYYLELNNNPTQSIINQIKELQDPMNISQLPVYCGGLSGLFYLRSFNLQIQPNAPIIASIDLVGFTPISGQIIANNTTQKNQNSSTSLAHSWTTKLQNDPIYNFSYSFDADVKPIYTIGNKYPIQVHYAGADETIRLLKSGFINIDPNNNKSEDLLSLNSGNINGLYSYYNTSYVYSLPINLSGFNLINSQVDISVDDIVKTDLTFIKSF